MSNSCWCPPAMILLTSSSFPCPIPDTFRYLWWFTIAMHSCRRNNCPFWTQFYCSCQINSMNNPLKRFWPCAIIRCSCHHHRPPNGSKRLPLLPMIYFWPHYEHDERIRFPPMLQLILVMLLPIQLSSKRQFQAQRLRVSRHPTRKIPRLRMICCMSSPRCSRPFTFHHPRVCILPFRTL
jgi:hypothetical protein